MSAGLSSRRSLMLSLAQKYAILVIRLVSLVVLSRLLAPAELGFFVAAAAIVALGHVIADCGVHQYLIQRRELTRDDERAALGAGLTTSLVAAASVVAFSIAAPSSLIDDGLRNGVQLLALTLLLYPFSTVATAILQRQMRFAEISWVAVAAALGSVIVSIALALFGFSYMSLVWGMVAEAAIGTVLFLRLHGAVRPRFSGWRPLFGFGWVWTSFNGLKQTADALVRLAVGAALGFGAVGLLARAQNVLLMFDKALMDALSPVLLPALSERIRSGGQIATMHRRMIAYLSVTAWPFFGLLALCADPLVRLLLGPQWTAAIDPVRILCIGGLFLPFAGLILQFLIALGIMRQYLPYQAAIQSVKAVLALGACQVSLEAVCLVLAAEPLAKGLFAQQLVMRHLGTGPRDYLGALATSAAAAAAALAGGAAAILAIGPDAPPLTTLAACAAGAVLPWLAAIMLLDHPILDELRRAAAHLGVRWPAIFAVGGAPAGGDADTRQRDTDHRTPLEMKP